MKFIDSVLIFSFLAVGIHGAVTGPVTDLPPALSPTSGIPYADISKHKTTTVAPATTTTTTSTTSESTTSQPISTTSTPATAPTSTSTSAPLTSSTTAAPSTTSATTIQPPPMPTPSEPEARNWTLTDGNRTCILVELATQLNISYTTNDNKTKYFTYNIPKDSESTVSGSCGNNNDTSDQFMLIAWSDKAAKNTLNMIFKLNHTSEYSLNEVVFNLSQEIFPNDANQTGSPVYYHVGSFFATPKKNSYHCTRPQILNLTNSENSNDTVGTVTFSHVLLEAYHEGKNTQFSTSIDCDAISTPDIVPIAVGIALIALVIIVLIAYVIGRRRSQAHGYVSM